MLNGVLYLMYGSSSKINTVKICKTLVKRYGSIYLLSRDLAGLKWRPVSKAWEQLQDKHS